MILFRLSSHANRMRSNDFSVLTTWTRGEKPSQSKRKDDGIGAISRVLGQPLDAVLGRVEE